MKTPEQIAQDILDELDLGSGLREGKPKTVHDLTSAMQSGWIEGDTVLSMIQSAIEADRAQREGRIYVAGEPDDTPNDLVPCESQRGGLFCTRLVDHNGNHAAGDGKTIVGVWDA